MSSQTGLEEKILSFKEDMMKMFLPALALGLALSACNSNKNIPDRRDSNLTPAPMEEREEEFVNEPDYIDENVVPASEEEREKEEEDLYVE